MRATSDENTHRQPKVKPPSLAARVDECVSTFFALSALVVTLSAQPAPIHTENPVLDMTQNVLLYDCSRSIQKNIGKWRKNRKRRSINLRRP